jgi:signal transduction histidine kinase
MGKEILAHQSYRKVVAALNHCEERYAGLVGKIDGAKDARFEAIVTALKKEVALRRDLEVELLTAVETERQRIGQDLHDDLCQRLSATAMLLGSVARKVNALDPKLGQEMSGFPQLINDTIESCRNIARGLHPVTLASAGLPAAFEELGTRVPMDIKFEWPHTGRIELEPDIALHLYRITEEAVGNAVKHSEATRISIGLSIQTGKHVLSISDNGRGIPVESLKARGMGLRNMQFRANAIGAQLSVEASPGGGTCVRCTLPVPKQDA